MSFYCRGSRLFLNIFINFLFNKEKVKDSYVNILGGFLVYDQFVLKR